MSNSPVMKFRIGFITANVWENAKEGRTFYTVDVTRTYKDGDDLKSTTSFGHADLMNVAKVAARAEAWIADQL